MKIEIKNRFTGNVIFAHECENNTFKITVLEAIKSRANLLRADLSEANLTGANLTGANLSEANLTGADLNKAFLSRIKYDFFGRLLTQKNEVPFLKKSLIDGLIDGSQYEGECCCFVGTIANVKKCRFDELSGLQPDPYSPTERWFLAIRKGDTPENSQIAKITLEWIEEFENLLK